MQQPGPGRGPDGLVLAGTVGQFQEGLGVLPPAGQQRALRRLAQRRHGPVARGRLRLHQMPGDPGHRLTPTVQQPGRLQVQPLPLGRGHRAEHRQPRHGGTETSVVQHPRAVQGREHRAHPGHRHPGQLARLGRSGGLGPQHGQRPYDVEHGAAAALQMAGERLPVPLRPDAAGYPEVLDQRAQQQGVAPGQPVELRRHRLRPLRPEPFGGQLPHPGRAQRIHRQPVAVRKSLQLGTEKR